MARKDFGSYGVRGNGGVSTTSIIGLLVIPAVLACCYQYAVLKLGLGPNMSILAIMFGAVWMMVLKPKGQDNLHAINLIQTSGTVASSMAFMCVIYASFVLLGQNEAAGTHVTVTPWQMFMLLALTGVLGVYVSAVFRPLFMNDPDMVFPDGVAAAKTVEAIAAGGRGSGAKLKVLGFGTLFGGLTAFVREKLALLPNLWLKKPLNVGVEWSLLSFGSGMLIPVGVGLSMLAGMLTMVWFAPTVIHASLDSIVAQSVLPKHLPEVLRIVHATGGVTAADSLFLKQHGGVVAPRYFAGNLYPASLAWFMWAATFLMIAESLASVVLKWRALVGMFQAINSSREPEESDVVGAGALLSLIVSLSFLLVLLMKFVFGMPFWLGIVGVLASALLIVAGVRVLGQTNQGPVSLMANALQVLLRLFSKSIAYNLEAAGIAGTINACAEAMMQCFKTGKIIKASPRVITHVAAVGAVIGAAMVAIMFPVLVKAYGIGPGGQLAAPTALKIANMAVLLSRGFSALPPGALLWSFVAVLVGILLAVLKHATKANWVPSASGFGFGMILPGVLILPLAAGSVLGWAWQQFDEESHEHYCAIVASGFISGDTFVAGLLLPLYSIITGSA